MGELRIGLLLHRSRYGAWDDIHLPFGILVLLEERTPGEADVVELHLGGGVCG